MAYAHHIVTASRVWSTAVAVWEAWPEVARMAWKDPDVFDPWVGWYFLIYVFGVTTILMNGKSAPLIISPLIPSALLMPTFRRRQHDSCCCLASISHIPNRCSTPAFQPR